MRSKPWSQWNKGDWNRALFQHFFGPDENDEPVTRLLVTARGLANAVGCEAGQEAAVEECFRRVLTASPTRINARFRRDFFSFSPPYDEPPRAVLHLLFTCYVASAGDEEIRNVGVFRKRMARVLGHTDEPFYPLDGLGHIWQQFDAWLGRARREGFAWRRLQLPDPGSMVRIGYSLKLAFPHRRDQALLEQILFAKGFAAQPPLRELLELLRPWRDQFTDTFRAAYDEFRQSFIAGRLGEHSALLDAVRDAIAHGETERAQSGKIGLLCLVAERDDRGCLRLLLLSDRMPTTGGRSRLGAFEVDRAQEPFRYAITCGHADFEGADTIIEFLLANELADHWRDFKRDPLARIAGDGVLLFHRATSGLLECARNLNVEGDVWPLVHRRLSSQFHDALGLVRPSEPGPFGGAYADWREFGAIPAAQLRTIDWTRDDDLASVRCLQQCAPENRITLVGGVQTGEPRTWFGHRVVLPAVRVHGGAEAVTLNTENGVSLGNADPIADEPELFSLRTLTGEVPLEGEHIVTAQRIDAPPLRRRVCFRAFVDRIAFLKPSKPERWLCEGALADMVQWNPDAAFSDLDVGDEAPPRDSASTETFEGVSPELSARVAALTEICAARCTRRRDFSESEWIEVFGKVFDVQSTRLARWVLRAWVEAGLFDQGIDAAWRSRRLFARSPRFALSRDTGGLKARLIGLAPAMLVNRLRQQVAEAGGNMVQRPSASSWVAGAWEIRGLEREVFEGIAQDLSMADTVRVPAPTKLVSEWEKLRRHLPQRPLHYKKYCEWNWANRRFEEVSPTEQSIVRLEWCQRRERFDAPDYFVVTQDGVEEFVSYSRNWALLVAARLAAEKPFIRAGAALISVGDPWVFLPLAVGRYCFAAGAAAAGPRRAEDGAWRYVYPLGIPSAGQRILANLGIASEAGCAASPPLWLEALAVARSRREALLPLPTGFPRRRVPASLRPLYLAHGRTR